MIRVSIQIGMVPTILFTALLGTSLQGQDETGAHENCQVCHRCENPTALDPCLITCPRHGAPPMGAVGSTSGEELVVLDELVSLYEPVVFLHGFHASMAALSGGCTVCHHYSEPGGKIPPCRECHDEAVGADNIHQPTLKGAYHRQCLNCHREWSHEAKCTVCHETRESATGEYIPIDKSDIVGIPHPKIKAEPKYVYQTPYEPAPIVTFHHTDHVDQFGLKCANCHQGDNCGRCHEMGHKRREIEHVKTCIACHYEDNCRFCHSNKEKPPFDHTVVIGWELGPHHEEAECEACHGSTKAFRTPSTSCTHCHEDWELGTFDHARTGLALSEIHVELECVMCHVEERFDSPPTCDICHDDVSYPDFYPGEGAGD